MKVDFRTLAKTGIRTLTPYQSGKPLEELERESGITSSIKLASNENPLGPSRHVFLAAEQALQQLHIYPDSGYHELKHSLASFHSVQSEQITIGNGSENILELIVKTYLHENHHAIISQYSFLTISLLIQGYGATAKVIPAIQWGHDIPGMIEAIDEKTRLLFLINPNNPTGTYTGKTDFLTLMQSVPADVLVVVDEAYAEYITHKDYPHALSYLPHFPNLVITRTFSKIYGLAALRLGYAISSPEIADMLNRSRLPFNVNSIAAKAACAALKDQEHVRLSIAMNQKGMQQMEKGLQQLNLATIPSLGNFITVKVNEAGLVYQQLLQEGIIVRPLYPNGMPHHLRITIGTPEQNEQLLRAMEMIL